MRVFKIISLYLLFFTSFSIAQSIEIGNDYMKQGRADLAIKHYKSILSTDQTTTQRYFTYRQLGLAYFSIGSYASANQNMRQAYNLNLSLYDEKSDERASIYNDLGLINSTHQPIKALEFYKKNQAIYTQKYGEKDLHLATVLTNIGVIQIQQGEYTLGINQLKDALKINVNNDTRKAFIYSQLGQAYLLNSQDDLASQFTKDALGIYLKEYGEKHPEVAQTFISLGNIELYRKHHKKALANYQYALIANSDYETLDIYQLPTLDTKSLSNTLFLNTLHLKAQVFEQLYFEKSLNRKDLLITEKHLEFCAELFENIQRTQPEESDKLALSTLSHSIYQDAVRVSMELAEISITKSIYYKKAFCYAENSSASLLLDAIQDAKAKNFSGLPDEILEQEKALKASMFSLRKQKLERSTAQLEKKILKSTNAYKDLIHVIEEKYPKYYELKFSRKKATLQDIQKKLPDGETLIQYFLDEQNNILFTFVITNSTYKVHSKVLPTSFNRNLVGFKNAIYYDVKSYISSLGKMISKTLLPRIPKGTKNIVFIPSGNLNKLPFEVLQFKNKFLIESFAISYHYTASLHTNSLQKNDSGPKNIGLFAPVNFDRQKTLIGTELEVKQIKKLFSTKKLEADVFLMEEASESTVKKIPPNSYDILHFATHGEVNSKYPELSKIYLKANDNEDGKLHTGEIYNLNLSSSLVTLSACETGLGKQQKGEGVMGLSRALIYAGANNLIVSYWKVNDDATTELMYQFYNILLETRCPYKTAIRASKLALIKSNKYSAPKFWSAFVLIGK